MFRLQSINKWDLPGCYEHVIITNQPPSAPPSRLTLSPIISLDHCTMIAFLSLSCHSHLPESPEKVLLCSSRYYPGPSCCPKLPHTHTHTSYSLSITPPVAPPFPSVTTIIPLFIPVLSTWTNVSHTCCLLYTLTDSTATSAEWK